MSSQTPIAPGRYGSTSGGQPWGPGWEEGKVQPPSGLFISRDDQLVVVIYNAAAGITVDVRARILLPNGEVAPQVWSFTPTSARARFVQIIEGVEGYLVGLSAAIGSGSPRRGQTFVQVSLGRGPASSPIVLQTLVSDYATPDAAIGWPGGLVRQSVEGPGVLRSVLGTDRAAGVEISEPLVASGAAANRRVHLIVDDATTTLFELAAADLVIAGQTRNFNFIADSFARATQDNEIYVPLPVDVVLFQGWRVRTATTALDAGDNWGPPQLLVEEWIEA